MSLLARLLAGMAIWRRVLRGRGAAHLPTEHDPGEREVLGNRRAELLAAVLLVLTGVFALAFLVLYAVYDNTQLLGLTAGLALLCLAIALMLGSLKVVPQVTEAEERSQLDHGVEQQDEVAEEIRAGGEGISRRKLLAGAGGVAAAGLGVITVVPAASLGPRIQDRLTESPWRRGRRVVDENDRVISADDLDMGAFITGFPQGADKEDLGSPVVIVRVDPKELDLPKGREGWAPEGIVAYSKICTHAACAVSLYRYPLDRSTAQQIPALVCPCHYSTFDPARGAKVTFGPAGRPLPQLPLMIDASRELRAGGHLSDGPGPAWWGTSQPQL